MKVDDSLSSPLNDDSEILEQLREEEEMEKLFTKDNLMPPF